MDTNIEWYYSILKELLKIGDKSYFLMKSSSSFYKKRLILNLIISNCFIEGKNIVISIIKSLETILNFKGCPTWIESTRLYRAENPIEFERLGKVAEIFMRDWFAES